MTANDNDPSPRPGARSRRGAVAALIAVAVIGFALFWAMSAIRSHDAIQDCIDSGRHGCGEAATP